MPIETAGKAFESCGEESSLTRADQSITCCLSWSSGEIEQAQKYRIGLINSAVTGKNDVRKVLLEK